MFITKRNFDYAIKTAESNASVKGFNEAQSSYNRKIAMCTAFLDHDDKHASFEQYNADVIKSAEYSDFYQNYQYRINQYFAGTQLIPSSRRIRILLYHMVFVSNRIEVFKCNYSSDVNEKLNWHIIKLIDDCKWYRSDDGAWKHSVLFGAGTIIEKCYSEEAAIKQARFLNKKQLAIMNSNFIASLFASPALPRVS